MSRSPQQILQELAEAINRLAAAESSGDALSIAENMAIKAEVYVAAIEHMLRVT